MLVHPSFGRFRDQISIRLNGRTYRYCDQCGYRLRCDGDYLKKHYKRFHEGHDAKWLKYGELPKCNWYANLASHFENPEVELQLR